LDTGVVSEAKLAASAVSQGKLKTASGTASNNDEEQNLVLAGGAYGFYPRISASSSSMTVSQNVAGIIPRYDAIGNTWSAFTLGTSYVTRIGLGHNDSGVYYIRANQTYVQASPPYDLGDGDVPLFIFMTVKSDGAPGAIYVAPEAPWHHNGPTRTIAWRRDQFGRGFRHVLPIEAELLDAGLTRPAAIRAGMFTRESLVARFAEDRAAVKADPAAAVEIEVTQDIKQADMPLIPHPFTGNNLAGKTVVMLDPVSPLMEQLLEAHDQGDDIAGMISNGYLSVGNTELGRARPPGVMSAGISWRNTA
jgi:hypothetical protein